MGVGCKDSMGGIIEVYAIKADYVDDVVLDSSADSSTYHMITAISTKAVDSSNPEHFKTFKVRRQTSSLTSTMTTDEAIGTFSVQSDLALQFTKMSTYKSEQLMGLLTEDLAVIVKDRNQKLWYLGYESPVTASAGTAQTGVAMGDLSGYNVTLTDISRRMPYEVVPTAIESILDEAPAGE